MYREQTEAVLIMKKKIKRGARQGCMLSPDHFSFYSEMIMRILKGYPKIKVRRHNVDNLKYADDTVFVVNKEHLQRLLDIVEKENRTNSCQSKYECQQITIFINQNKLKQMY